RRDLSRVWEDDVLTVALRSWQWPTEARATLKKAIVVALAFVPLTLSLQAAPGRWPAPAAVSRGTTVNVIVREARPSSTDAERLVDSIGGRVTRQLPMVGGFSARLPAAAVRRLLESASVTRVWRDGRIRMSGL